MITNPTTQVLILRDLLQCALSEHNVEKRFLHIQIRALRSKLRYERDKRGQAYVELTKLRTELEQKQSHATSNT